MILIGTDEAGYGPNLGPLAVSASVWATPSDDLSAIGAPLAAAGLTIDDSKKLYRGDSLAALERSVLTALESLDLQPRCSREIRRVTRSSGDLPDEPVCSDGPVALPREIDETDLPVLAGRFRDILRKHRIELRDLKSRMIFPSEFNSLLDRHDSKGSLLSAVTMALVLEAVSAKSVLADESSDGILVLCDKHGGRNRYLDLICGFFPGEFIRTIREGRDESVYRTKFQGRPVEFRFCARGESRIPIALASMLSKYLRESAMLEFNAFWQARVPGLRKTAGYPADAGRFRAEIAAARDALKIDDDALWRKR